MHRRISVATATFALVALCSLAQASDRLIGGVPAEAGEWPASVVVSIGNSRCSGTLVGEHTLLVAAHCTGAGAPVTFSVGPTAYTAKCQRHSAYPDQDVDVALCRVDKDVKDVTFERVLVDGSKIAVGQTLRLTGYGCTQAGGTGGGNDGVFRTGDAPVVDLPRDTSVDVVTEGTAALCFGDSGGAGFLVEDGTRYVVGVNSKGDIVKRSYLAATFDPKVVEFFKTWSAANDAKICGVDEAAENCRSAGPPTSFKVDTEAATATVRVKPAYATVLEKIRAAVEAALAP